MISNNRDVRRAHWLWVCGLGIALCGCSKAADGERKPTASKEDIAACNANCEQLAAAEKHTCEKPVLDPQMCHKAIGYAEQDCKQRCPSEDHPPPSE